MNGWMAIKRKNDFNVQRLTFVVFIPHRYGRTAYKAHKNTLKVLIQL